MIIPINPFDALGERFSIIIGRAETDLIITRPEGLDSAFNAKEYTAATSKIVEYTAEIISGLNGKPKASIEYLNKYSALAQILEDHKLPDDHQLAFEFNLNSFNDSRTSSELYSELAQLEEHRKKPLTENVKRITALGLSILEQCNKADWNFRDYTAKHDLTTQAILGAFQGDALGNDVAATLGGSVIRTLIIRKIEKSHVR